MILRDVKQRFFAFRNGLLADMLRRQGASNHRTIFGLNVPQLREIAAQAGVDPELAELLWADADVRESRLLAPMVSPPVAEAFSRMDQVQTAEEADILCHSLLRRCPGALNAAEARLNAPQPLVQYCALRLLLNLAMNSAQARAAIPALLAELKPLNSANSGLADRLRQLLADYEENAL
ncbi:MAG: DNA alkylation repair protein [Muribaculaceae bacterium]|nr:DNA alkylation repair protein [Muribaculaceae bacterium]MDE7334773.1 DNA alkylation repair protein [Muribaculaceae bacterium]